MAHTGWLYGLVTGADETTIWRTDGKRSRQVWTAPAGWHPTDLTGDGTELWMVGQRAGESRLWQGGDGPLAHLLGNGTEPNRQGQAI